MLESFRLFSLTRAADCTSSCTNSCGRSAFRTPFIWWGLQIMRMYPSILSCHLSDLGNRPRHVALLLPIMALAMSGCAAITGMPEPLKSTQEVMDAKICPSDQQLTAYYGATVPPGFSSKANYRDYVIAGCVNALNAKYTDFKAKLQETAVSANLITDIMALGLSGAGAVTTGDGAKLFSEGATVVTGTGAAIDKDIFYQQTLPAVISAMEANRATALKTIIDREAADKTGGTYGLADAVGDLNAYEAAGNIYRAISDLTKSANVQEASASTALSKAELNKDKPYALIPEFAESAYVREKKLRDCIYTLKDPGDRDQLDTMAKALGLNDPATTAFVLERRHVVREIDRLVNSVAGEAAQNAQMDAIEKSVVCTGPKG
jgi:hypothetical protein